MRKIEHLADITNEAKTVRLFYEVGLPDDLIEFIHDDQIVKAITKSLLFFLHGSPSTRYCGYGKGVNVDNSIKHFQAGRIVGKTGEMRLVCKEVEVEPNVLWIVIISDWYKKNKELPGKMKKKLENDIQYREYEYE